MQIVISFLFQAFILQSNRFASADKSTSTEKSTTAESLKEIISTVKRIEINLRSSQKGTVDIVLGAQWGDEGKGKLVGILSADYDICARVAGGSNAGHTIVVNVSHSADIFLVWLYTS